MRSKNVLLVFLLCIGFFSSTVLVLAQDAQQDEQQDEQAAMADDSTQAATQDEATSAASSEGEFVTDEIATATSSEASESTVSDTETVAPPETTDASAKKADEQGVPEEKKEKPKAQEVVTPDVKDQEQLAIEGLDTVSVREPEGNWLLKRIWWEKAQKKFEKIREGATMAVESKMPFYNKRNEIDRNVLDPFYSDMGLSQGQLKEVVQILLDQMKQEREEDVTLSVKEREFLETLKAEENKLKQLNADVKAIKKLDMALDDDLIRLTQEINKSRRYEDNAWQLFKGIAKELSHKKARELYYKMDALWKNVKGINDYIRGAFARHFDSVVENIKTQTERIRNIAKEFQEKGIDLKNEFTKLEGRGTAQLLGQTKPQVKPSESEISEKEDKEKDAELYEEETGFFGSIWNAITWPFKKVWGLISGSKDDSEDALEESLEKDKSSQQSEGESQKLTEGEAKSL